MGKLGVMIVGVGGAVASTVIAGVELMLRGAVPRIAMITENTPTNGSGLPELLDFAPLRDFVFAGWDVKSDDLYAASLKHKVLAEETLAAIADELRQIRPWRAVFSQNYAQNLRGDNIVVAASFREQVQAIERDIERFKRDSGVERVVMVNLASTEAFVERSSVHETLEAFERGLDANDPNISPAMRYFYAANRTRTPYCNFTPSLTNVPALAKQAHDMGNPFAGVDGKTGQTLVKTALASMLRVRQLLVEGWYSVNFLGNSDGLVLAAPESNKTKVLSKSSVLDSIVGYPVENHQVHIHYYKPRGDAKEAWDNVDIVGFGGVRMQMKINFLCQDSILAAPLVIDLIRLMDVAKRAGGRGIQRQLSLFFKSPDAAPGETPVHDLFKQEQLLLDWAVKHSAQRPHANPGPLREKGVNGAQNGAARAAGPVIETNGVGRHGAHAREDS